jgi:FkbM family methyltransferase
LATNGDFQSSSSLVYNLFKKLLIVKYAAHYEKYSSVSEIIGVKVDFPFISMGAINSRHFFGIDEILIYDFYKRNRSKYSKVCDIGCNVGLHSKILCELGYQVDSYEPDKTHAEISKKYLKGYKNNTFYQKAVSSYSGKATFTRILNNTTGSYINDKKESFGPTEKYEVEVIDAKGLSNKYDLIKMDIEGSEADVLSALEPSISIFIRSYLFERPFASITSTSYFSVGPKLSFLSLM